jgi:UDP-glucose 4-epimerase
MRVLVTGASGYLGQWACLGLREAGHEVRGYARSPRPLALDVDWVQGDIADGTRLDEAVRGCARIVHLATLAHGPSGRDPIEAERVNSLGTARLMVAARGASVPHVVYASTAYVYGSCARSPYREEQPAYPDTPYGVSKLAGEIWCEAYARAGYLTTCTLRIFNVYGPAADGSPRSSVETLFLNSVKQGRRPFVTHPDSARDFIHMSDVVRALRMGLDAQGVYNIGTGAVTSLPELARMIAELAGVRVDPEIATTDEPPTRIWADPRRAASELGFTARIPIAEGLRMLLQGS